MMNTNFIERTELLKAYQAKIREYDVMTPDEEAEAFIRLKNGDETARAQIIMSNQRYIYSMAKKYNSGYKIMDIISEANIGLMKAIDLYDVTKGFRFLTYAKFYIKREIRAYLLNDEAFIKKYRAGTLSVKINAIKSKFFSENGYYPSIDDIKQILEKDYNITFKDKVDIKDISVLYTDNSIDDDGSTFETSQEYTNATATNNDYIKDEEEEYKSEMVNEMLAKMRPLYKNENKYKRDIDIIKMSFGIGYNGKEYTNDEIAKKYDMTTERVRQIIQQSIENIRKKAV